MTLHVKMRTSRGSSKEYENEGRYNWRGRPTIWFAYGYSICKRTIQNILLYMRWLYIRQIFLIQMKYRLLYNHISYSFPSAPCKMRMSDSQPYPWNLYWSIMRKMFFTPLCFEMFNSPIIPIYITVVEMRDSFM